MFIQTLLPPVAGQEFRFSVAGCSGITNVKVHAGNKQLLNRKFIGLLCKAKTLIPEECSGATLRISATDMSGKPQSIQYEISESDPGPHSMLAVTR